jgi:hypothetical protein
MEWSIPAADRQRLRELARAQAEYAALPVMSERKRLWYALNDGLPDARPLIVIEAGTFDHDFLPSELLRCESDTGRGIERQLLRPIRNHELIDDDKVVPDSFDLGWIVAIDELGVSVPRETVADSRGVEVGYRCLHPIRDLKRDLELLRPATCRVARELTLSLKEMLEELFDGILRVRIHTGTFGGTTLTERVIWLMGMEAFFLALHDSPDEVHALMAYLRDNALRVMRWAEHEQLLRLNNGNQDSFGSSYNFTTRLPGPGHADGPARLCDMWGFANSQETVGISPAMFREFCFPYYRDVCEPMGLVYWGCCEPAHPFWEDIRRLPHLKKVSISRWCDQRFMGEALQGTEIVFSRKPDPNLLGVHADLDEEAWAAHIRETLEATPGVRVEFIVRDVYTVHGSLDKPRRAVEIARAEIDRHARV